MNCRKRLKRTRNAWRVIMRNPILLILFSHALLIATSQALTSPAFLSRPSSPCGPLFASSKLIPNGSHWDTSYPSFITSSSRLPLGNRKSIARTLLASTAKNTAATSKCIHDGSSRESSHNNDVSIIDQKEEEEEVIIQQILKGKHKWLGGAVDNNSDGSVYGIPSHSKHIICLSPPRQKHLSLENDANIVDADVDDSSTYEIHMLPLPSSLMSRDLNNNNDHHFQWLRGIITNRTLYGIPSWARSGVLKVDIDGWRKWREQHPNHRIVDDDDVLENLVTVLPLPEEPDVQDFSNAESTTKSRANHRWMWHGAALNQNSTAIYCIPSNAQHVLKVDLVSLSTSYLLIPPRILSSDGKDHGSDKNDDDDGMQQHQQEEHAKLLQLTNKWYGGILGDDNAIYGVPYACGSILRIDANVDRVSLLGDFGHNMYNWHGGIKAPRNGCIYAFPAHSEMVLKIDTGKMVGGTVGGGGCDESRLSLLPIHRAPYDTQPITRYKWLGGSLGADGNIYGMPSDASSVLKIGVDNDVVTTFGWVETSSCDEESFDDGGVSTRYYEKNKWQGGVLGRDSHIYAVPSNAKGVLRIDTRPDESAQSDAITFLGKDRVTCIGDLPETKDKWQGGFAVRSGAIYGIPENCNRVLKVLPPFPGCAGDAAFVNVGDDNEISFDGVVVRMLQ